MAVISRKIVPAIVYSCVLLLFGFAAVQNTPAEDTEDLNSIRSRSERRYTELVALLNKEQIAYETRPLLKNYGAYGSSVFVYSPASAKAADITFVLAVPITTLDNAEIEVHTGFDLAVQFIKTIQQNPGAPPVLTAFLADEWIAPAAGISYAGFADLLDTLEQTDNVVILYADIAAEPVSLNIVHGSTVSTASSGLLSSFIDTCKTYNIPFSLHSRYNLLYKFAVAHTPLPVRMAGEREVPVLYCAASSSGFAGGTIATARLAALFDSWAADEPYRYSTEDSGIYFIAGIANRLVFLHEKFIIVLWYIFDIMLFVCLLLYQHEAGKIKMFFLMLSIFCAMFFMITALVDLALIPLTFPALLALPLLFLLHAAIKNKGSNSKKISRLLVAMTCFAVIISAAPFIDIVFEAARLVAEQQSKMQNTQHIAAASANTSSVITDDVFDLQTSTEPFLERTLLDFKMHSTIYPLYYRVIFRTEKNDFFKERIGEYQLPPFIYASPAPYTITDDGMELNLGAFPPKQLNLEIALPPELGGTFEVEAVYPEFSLKKSLQIHPR